MKKLLLGLSIISLFSCTKYEIIYPAPCDGNCDANFTIIYEGIMDSIDNNGYYVIEFNGLNYFQVKGQLSELNEQYVINDVPLIETKFDSDYWVVFDSIYFITPLDESKSLWSAELLLFLVHRKSGCISELPSLVIAFVLSLPV